LFFIHEKGKEESATRTNGMHKADASSHIKRSTRKSLSKEEEEGKHRQERRKR